MLSINSPRLSVIYASHTNITENANKAASCDLQSKNFFLLLLLFCSFLPPVSRCLSIVILFNKPFPYTSIIYIWTGEQAEAGNQWRVWRRITEVSLTVRGYTICSKTKGQKNQDTFHEKANEWDALHDIWRPLQLFLSFFLSFFLFFLSLIFRFSFPIFPSFFNFFSFLVFLLVCCKCLIRTHGLQ